MDEKTGPQDTSPEDSTQLLEETSLVQNTEGESANEMNGPSEEYLAYRCGFLDSIAQEPNSNSTPPY